MEVDQGNSAVSGVNKNKERRDPYATIRDVGESSTAKPKKGEKRSQTLMSEVGESSNVHEKNPQKKQKTSPPSIQAQPDSTKPKQRKSKEQAKQVITRLQEKQAKDRKNRFADAQRKKIAAEKKQAKAAQQQKEVKPIIETQKDTSVSVNNDKTKTGKHVHLIDASFIQSEHLTDIFWEDAEISNTLKNAIKKNFKFNHLTKIQDLCLKAFSTGKDVVAQAPTGTGKTLAFLVPILDSLSKERATFAPGVNVRAIILTHTKELIRQTHIKCSQMISETQKISVLKHIGKQKQVLNLNAAPALPTIVVSTPGGVLKTMKQYPYQFAHVKYVVLDEADVLLDEKSIFFPTIEEIKPLLPQDCHFSLFSATFNQSIKPNLVKILGPDYQFVSSGVNSDQPMVSASTKQYLSFSDSFQGMINALYTILTSPQYHKSKSIVFFPLNVLAQYFTKLFQFFGLNCSEFSGRTSSSKRNSNIDLFRGSKGGCIFSSDALARGIDINDVDLIIQFSVPQNSEFYIHRVGRTSRLGGTVGDSILILHSKLDEWFLERNLKPEQRKKLVLYDNQIRSVPHFVSSDLFLPEKLQSTSQALLRGFLYHYGVALKNKVSPLLVVKEILLFFQFLQIQTVPIPSRTLHKLNAAFSAILRNHHLVEK